MSSLVNIKKIVVEQPLLDVGCTLGEGPIYDPKTSTLHFVDIVEKKVFHYNIGTETREFTVDSFPESITSLALRRNKQGLACTTAQGFALLDSQSRIQYLSKPLSPNEVAHCRFNDGGCDRLGRYFAGTVQSEDPPIPGKLWRFDPTDGSCVVMDEGPFTDSNGLGLSPDDKTFYFTDSLVNIIYAYDYDDTSGKLSNRRVLVDANALGLTPNSFCDGLCIDTEGGIWSARWGGSCVIRFTNAGAVDVKIEFPKVLRVTACCFGGPNMDQLYVTTAHCGCLGGDASKQNEFPDSGNVFVVDLSGQYRGLARYEFAG
ncbi:hypothetical protein K435DRAFT_826674 [Dendrothele bispora CBS 962.96]|uniref:SMP-30/Gluconolactonase/LRE-like region domain-containing protein n=1 Tax=Dendrothele bispora (strain CBS 962.96) TaxID=1314807 RepID=A0A4S8MPC6_DENBC|nr:hypothetical protein K435DRAFT_826674 [Dendrothele bispora CBS 962.96]